MMEFYNSNMLKINPDKHQFMISARPKLLEGTKNLTFLSETHIIKQKASLKILGSYITPDLSPEREICSLIPILNNRINQLEKLNKYTTFQTRLQFLNGFVIGRMTYMFPTYTNLNLNQIGRLHRVLMRSARTCHNSYCFKQNISTILERCNWRDIKEQLILSSLNFCHNMLQNQAPHYLFNQLKIGRRTCTKLSFKNFPISTKRKRNLLYQSVSWYNKVSQDIKCLNKNKFKFKIKKERHLVRELKEERWRVPAL